MGWRSRFLAAVRAIMWVCITGTAMAAAGDIRRFDVEVRRFERQDATNPPPTDAVLFTGSSSIVKWTRLREDFVGLPVLNRGFGGSTWRELNHYFPQLVAKYHPRAVVVYEGDNDLAQGRSVAECVADFEEFRRLMHACLPDVPVAILTVKASPSRRTQRPVQEQLNAEVRRRLEGESGWTVLEVGRVLLDASGEPRPELFETDQLHLRRAGYALWVPVLRPWLDKFAGP